MSRRTITKTKRVRIFDRAGGVCHLCKLPINATRGEKWHVEHIKPLWEGGSDEESNMAPAHIDCHATKTGDEAPIRAKGTRQRARHIGAVKPKGSIPNRPKEAKPTSDKLPIPPRRSLYADITTEN